MKFKFLKLKIIHKYNLTQFKNYLYIFQQFIVEYISIKKKKFKYNRKT